MNRPIPYNVVRHHICGLIGSFQTATSVLEKPPIDVETGKELLGMGINKLKSILEEMDCPSGRVVGSYSLKSADGCETSGRADFTADGRFTSVAEQADGMSLFVVGQADFESADRATVSIDDSSNKELIGKRIEGELKLVKETLSFCWNEQGMKRSWVWKKL